MRRRYKRKSNTARDIFLLLAISIPAALWAVAYGRILAGY